MFYGNPTSTSGNYLYGNVSIPNNQNTGWYDLEVYDQNTNQWINKYSSFYVSNNYSGCTDPYACNYDSLATIDNGSCQYLDLSSYSCYDYVMNYGYSIYDMESYGWNCCGVEEYISSPQITSISSNSGDNGQSLSVTISGSNMNYGNQWSGTLSSFRFSQWSGTNMFYGNPTSTSGDYLYGNVSIPNNQNTGWYDLEVYDQSTNQWIQKNNAFYVAAYIPPVVQINSISPNNGDPGQTLSVTISGSNMNYGNQWSGTLSNFRFSQWRNQYVLWESNKYIWKLFVWKC